VINMSMGEKQKLNVGRFYRPSNYRKRFIRPLSDAAVNQDIQTRGLQKMAGTGNRFFSA
jgi:hypothetical protein